MATTFKLERVSSEEKLFAGRAMVAKVNQMRKAHLPKLSPKPSAAQTPPATQPTPIQQSIPETPKVPNTPIQQPKKQYQAPGEAKIGKLKQWRIEKQLKREANASLPKPEVPNTPIQQPKPETPKVPNSQPTSTQSSNTGGVGWTGQGTEGQYQSREQNKQFFDKVGTGAKKVGKGLGYTLLGTTALAGYGIKKIDDAANGYN